MKVLFSALNKAIKESNIILTKLRNGMNSIKLMY